MGDIFLSRMFELVKRHTTDSMVEDIRSQLGVSQSSEITKDLYKLSRNDLICFYLEARSISVTKNYAVIFGAVSCVTMPTQIFLGNGLAGMFFAASALSSGGAMALVLRDADALGKKIQKALNIL